MKLGKETFGNNPDTVPLIHSRPWSNGPDRINSVTKPSFNSISISQFCFKMFIEKSIKCNKTKIHEKKIVKVNVL